ncbi:MAG: pyruvate dehydrogenase (acetyl-transferring), homodimeric type, partial [Acidimicrobiia bacterium]
RFVRAKLLQRARERNIGVPVSVSTPYLNTIPPQLQPEFPGDPAIESRIRRITRWNAAVMVTKANLMSDGIGGHLSSFASSAMLYDVGFNHFFRGKADGSPGDHVYIQGHAAPGIYARSYLEHRIDEHAMDGFRRELSEGGMSGYPHPRLMPDYWEFPTVSMGLGPINSIYHARFLRYLHHRGLDDTTGSRVWGFLGDGECDEPETLGSISLAGREGLDNLTWVVNCNLQRLDGPVRGNGKIIQELEAMFRGAGWNVLKVIWGANWDPLIAADRDGVLVQRFNESVDGEYQRYKAEDGAFVRDRFFGTDPRLAALVEHLTDDEVWALRRGGLDYEKVHGAYRIATELEGAPTVILAKTIKGFMLGKGVQGGNATHQVKKLSHAQLVELRDALGLHDDVPDSALVEGEEPPYFRPAIDSPEVRYLRGHRDKLNGALPSRVVAIRKPLPLPGHEPFAEFEAGSGRTEVSTTGVYTRMLRSLARVDGFGERIVPIIPDEGRTFGMDALFKELEIYAAQGQLYEPVDAHLLLSYRESQQGQILEEGITEAGSVASWIAAATSYATRGVPMVPFFAFYSMFGFQRVGDLIWSAADSRARGFLLGATAGRTTLLGEGLQHQDGHSLVLASTVPVCRAYDPAFAYELATIFERGLHRMYGEGDDVFYYVTAYNEPYVQPPMPEAAGDGIMAGLYRWAEAPDGLEAGPAIIFSGAAHRAAREAQTDLAEHFGIGAELWSATSYTALREEALATERWNRLHPHAAPRVPYVTSALAGTSGPFVAVTDYMKLVPDQVGRWIPGRFTPLGTDGFGRSDTREALRRFFEVDSGHVVVAVLSGLAADGRIEAQVVSDAVARYDIDPETIDPATAH